MKNRYKSRARWLAERWLKARTDEVAERWGALKKQLIPADWPTRCERMPALADSDLGPWRPDAGSSSAELLLLLQNLSARDRRWLGALLDAPTAGAVTLVEAVERLQLDWRARLDPLRTHRQYAEQLATLTQALGLPSAAASAYLDNERKVAPRIDELLFESLPMRQRTRLVNEIEPGSGGYLLWWQERLLARCGEPGMTLDGARDEDWPDIPAAWFALGWIAALRGR